jgi:transcriptional regulator with XRE-family HTH domain
MNDANGHPRLHLLTLSPHVHEVLREKRLELRLPQRLVAEAVNISRTTLADFERGKRPHLGLLEIERIANTLGMSLITLLALTDQRHQQHLLMSQKQSSSKTTQNG